MAHAKKWGGRLATALVVLAILAVSILFAWPNSYNITNGSMVPTISVGTKVFAQQQASYEVGDIITFRAIEIQDHGPLVVTHRLVGFNDDGSLITQGDANDAVDYPAVPVYSSDIIGKVVGQVPIIGGVQMWLMANPLLWTPFVLIILLVLVWPLLGKSKPAPKEDSSDSAALQANATHAVSTT